MASYLYEKVKIPEQELLIGVDFGMSQTGYQNWSDTTFDIYNKAPSRLAYDKSGSVQAWGYFVDINDSVLDVKEYFKLYLDPDYNDGFQDMTHQVATQLYLDYLRCVHGHIVRFFRLRYPQWATMHVEWNFSVPTTWKSAALVNHLLSVICQAGFGTDGHNHRCEITLTEARPQRFTQQVTRSR